RLRAQSRTRSKGRCGVASSHCTHPRCRPSALFAILATMQAGFEQFAWASGLFEGEGTITHCAGQLHVRLVNTDHEVLQRFAEVMQVGTVYGPYERRERDGYPTETRLGLDSARRERPGRLGVVVAQHPKTQTRPGADRHPFSRVFRGCYETARSGARVSAASAGRRSVNAVRPGLDSSSSVPPIACVSSRAIASPRPLPEVSRPSAR